MNDVTIRAVFPRVAVLHLGVCVDGNGFGSKQKHLGRKIVPGFSRRLRRKMEKVLIYTK